MSLLEDVFLEDEAGEAQDLERIIEGNDFDERPRSRSDSDENSAKEDEAEEDKRRVDPTNAKPKRVIKNPRFVLNPARLTGPRGIKVLTDHFKDFKFKGKGHEREDLDLVLKKLEHWAYRLYPKFKFEDCLKKIETLGKKRAVSVHLHRIRTDQITSDETVVQKDSSDDEAITVQGPEEDDFDKLLQQQIEIARATPAPSSVKKTPFSDRSSMMPKATSSPSINDEQRERMFKSRRMAEERRLARLKLITSQENFKVTETTGVTTETENDAIERQKSVLNSSDDEDVIMNKNVTETHDSNKSETIELDDNGMVVTPKSYKPAKNRNSSKVDPDVLKSDSNIIGLDDVIVTESPKTYVPAKKHNKSRLNSSDDEDTVVNDPITIDVDKHYNDSPAKSSKTKTNKFKITECSSDDDLVNEPITVDVDQHHEKLSKPCVSSSDEDIVINEAVHSFEKHNRSNFIDSSESEEDAVIMNESLTVDIHQSTKHVSNDIVFDSLQTTNTIEIRNDDRNNIKIQQETIQNENCSSVLSENCIRTKINNKCIESDNVIENDINVTKTKIRDTIQVTNEQNVPQMENIDEVMDVDFSDDF